MPKTCYAFLPDADSLSGALTIGLWAYTAGEILNGESGDALTPVPDAPYWYSFSVTEDLTGVLRAVFLLDGEPIPPESFLDMRAVVPVVGGSPLLLSDVTNSLLASLSGMPVTITSPTKDTGDIELTVGDDYYYADGRALVFTNEAGTWPDLTNALVYFRAKRENGDKITQAGSVITPTGENQQVRIELPSSFTSQLEYGYCYKYEVSFVLSGSSHNLTLITGDIVLSPQLG